MYHTFNASKLCNVDAFLLKASHLIVRSCQIICKNPFFDLKWKAHFKNNFVVVMTISLQIYIP